MKTETKLPVNENEKEQKKNEWEKNKQKNANCCFFNWFFSVDLSIIIFPVYEWRMRKRLVDGFFFFLLLSLNFFRNLFICLQFDSFVHTQTKQFNSIRKPIVFNDISIKFHFVTYFFIISFSFLLPLSSYYLRIHLCNYFES